MKKINITDIASWLFGYYFASTILVAIVLLIFGPQSQALSLSDPTGIWAIIIPVFLGQVTILYQWFIKEAQRNEDSDVYIRFKKWILYTPPVAVLVLLLLSFVLRAMAVSENYSIEFSENYLKIAITLLMSILNVTTIALNTAIFKE